jgi:tetratricopeptide (TPR) repeat protein
MEVLKMKTIKIYIMILLLVLTVNIAQAQQSAFQGTWIHEFYPSFHARLEISGSGWQYFSNNKIRGAGTTRFLTGSAELLLVNGDIYYVLKLLAPGLIEIRGPALFGKFTQTGSNSQNDPQSNNIAQFHFEKGKEYYVQGDFDRAIEEYSNAIRLYPNFFQAFINRGITYSEKGNYEQAIIDYNQAIILNSNSASAYNSRGWVYFLLGNNDQAIADTTQSIRINPNYEFAYDSRGWAYLDKGDYVRATADFEMVLRINPNLELSIIGLKMARRLQSR